MKQENTKNSHLADDEIVLYNPTDDYDEYEESEDDIIEVTEEQHESKAWVTILGLVCIIGFCMLVFYLVSQGMLR